MTRIIKKKAKNDKNYKNINKHSTKIPNQFVYAELHLLNTEFSYNIYNIFFTPISILILERKPLHSLRKKGSYI